MKKTIKTNINEITNTKEKEETLRPQKLEDYIGQEKIKNRVSLSVSSSKKRNEPLDHILLFGPPGLGKTTLAYILANEMQQNIKFVAGPSLEKPGDIVAILNQLAEKDLLFIDEIHRMSKSAEEVLYSAMEDYFITINMGKDSQSKQIKLNLPKFTLIGATTKAGMLSPPLRDRFGLVCRMEYYTEAELALIGTRTSKLMNICLSKEALDIVAKCSRGTPRIINRTMARIRDYAIANNILTLDVEGIKKALETYGIKLNGLNETDMNILTILADKNGPIGLETLAALSGEDSGTIESVYEPYLLMQGYIEKTPKGRKITEKGKIIL